MPTPSGDSALLPGLGRRQLFQVFGAAAVLAVAGCSSAVKEREGAAAGGGAPRRGGTLTAGITEDLVPGNFFTNSSAGLTVVIGLAYDSVIRYGNDKVEPTPRLATAWELAPDGKSLKLTLRDDVTFHSGRPFTSKDVEFSLKTYADPKWNGQLKSTAQAITGYDTSQDHEITLAFAHPLGNIFDLLDTVPVVDRETLDELGNGTTFNGTGPFRFDSWTPNSKLAFSRNEKYWVPERPYLDAVDVSVIPNATSLLAATRSGEVKVAYGLSFRDIETVSGRPGFGVVQGEGAEQQIYVGANVEAAGLDDIRLRRAIAYALDRERVLTEVFRGSGYTVNLPWPKYSAAFDEARNTTYAYDVTQAKALVAEIGDVPRLPLTYIGANPSLAATAQIVQANLEAVGIPVQLDPVDGAQFVKQLIGAQFKGLWTTYHSWAQYTPSTLNVSAYPFNALKNASNFSSDAYTQASQAAWKTADGTSDAARAEYAKVSDVLLEDLFLIEIAIIQDRWLHAEAAAGISYTKRHEIQLTDAYLAQAD